MSGLKRVSIIARSTSIEGKSVGLAERVHLLAAHARSKEIARVAAHADSGLIGGFAVGIAAGGWRVSNRAVAVVETVARVAGETSSGVGIAGLAERIALDAHEGRIQEESTVTLLADSISQVLAVDIAVGCTSDCASRTSNHIPRVASQASSGVGIGSLAERAHLSAFSRAIKVKLSGALSADRLGLVVFLAVGILEGNSADASIEGIAREARKAGSIDLVGGLAEWVERLTGRNLLIEVVTSVAADAHSALRVASAVRILLFRHDTVRTVDYVTWVAGQTGAIGVVSVAEGIYGYAGAG